MFFREKRRFFDERKGERGGREGNETGTMMNGVEIKNSERKREGKITKRGEGKSTPLSLKRKKKYIKSRFSETL